MTTYFLIPTLWEAPWASDQTKFFRPPTAKQEIERKANFSGQSVSQGGHPYKSFSTWPCHLNLPSSPFLYSPTLSPAAGLLCPPQLPGPHHPPVALFGLLHLPGSFSHLSLTKPYFPFKSAGRQPHLPQPLYPAHLPYFLHVIDTT